MGVEGLLDRLAVVRAARALYYRTPLREAEGLVPRVSPQEYRENLEAIVSYCRRRGIRPVFLALPRRHRPGAPPKPDTPYPDLLRASAAELGVRLLVVPPLTAGTAEASNEEYFVDTLHLSEAGHRHLADAIAEALAAEAAAAPTPDARAVTVGTHGGGV
jgi:lysophospholipase L1-like esterase